MAGSSSLESVEMETDSLLDSPPPSTSDSVANKKPIGRMKKIRPGMKRLSLGDQDEALLDEHLKYHSAMAKVIRGFRSGLALTKIRIPCAPKSKIEPILKGIPKKRGSKETKGRIMVNVNQMDEFEFDQYLRSKLINVSEVIDEKEHDMSTMDGVAKELKRLNARLKQDDGKSLKKHLHLGGMLEFAFKKFMAEKKKTKSKEKWGDWIEENTAISGSYSRRLRDMAGLANQFPKLKDLGLSFTDFFKVKGKIEKVFGSNIRLARKWQ